MGGSCNFACIDLALQLTLPSLLQMAHLPPKAPTMTFPWQQIPSSDATIPDPSDDPLSSPSWVEEFLDFSSAKRGVHRRSSSDSLAFIEVHQGSSPGFHDDDGSGQFMSILSCDVPALVSASSPSTPSDHNSINEDQPTPSEQPAPLETEVQSSCKSDTQPPQLSTSGNDSIVDPKRVKRILANRQSAQRSRVRKLQYIYELERSVTTLQTEVSVLSPRVAFLDHQRVVLNVDNNALKQRIAALAQDKIFKDAHQEALKKEIERLRELYNHQSLAQMNNVPLEDCSEHSQYCSKKELVS